MGIVVAIKYNGAVYIGSDSQAQGSGVNFVLGNPDNFRIFSMKNCNNILGAVGESILFNNIIRCSNIIPKEGLEEEIDFEYLVNNVVPHLFSIAEERHLISISDDHHFLPTEIIFANKDKLFQISYDGSVIECEDYAAIGKGMEIALGSLLSTYDIEDPEERLKIAITAVIKNKTSANYPIIIFNTNDCKYKIIEE